MNTSAAEDCDGIDNNCDGEVDEGASTFYADTDGDGYGDSSVSTEGCTADSGYVSDSTDCDDSDGEVNPGATEICDDIDNDCDELIDDADSGLDTSTASTWYADGDGDGYGDPDASQTTCDAASGYLSDNTDCDDDDDDTYPGAASTSSSCMTDADGDGYGDDSPASGVTAGDDCDDTDSTVNTAASEICDSIDNDCDGATDDDDSSVDTSTGSTYYRDADSDGYGDADTSTEACAQPTGHVTSSTDCDDDESGANPGGTESCDDGIDNDCDGTANSCELSGTISLADADAVVEGVNNYGYLGKAVSIGGDVDGDGYNDLLIGRLGRAYLVHGATYGTSNTYTADADLVGEDSNDGSGSAVALEGDFNGDGYADAVVGADEADTSSISQGGAAYVVLGPMSNQIQLSAADVKWHGVTSEDYAGRSLHAGGDVNGDGKSDLVIGAWGVDTNGSKSGAAYLVLGPTTGSATSSLSLADGTWRGVSADDYAGYAVASGGDVDGDGLDDILVGAYGEDTGGASAGMAYLILGPGTGESDLSSADAKLIGEGNSDYAGVSLANGGDVNGDGLDDVVVGIKDGSTGAAYLLVSPVDSYVSLASADAKLTGTSSNDYAGSTVSCSGDINGDGFFELTIAAYNADDYATQAGAVYIFSGPVSGTMSVTSADVTFYPDASYGRAGSGLSVSGDVNGDGFDDVLVGVPYYDANGTDSGAAFLVYGGGL